MMPDISAEEFIKLLAEEEEKVQILDVREPLEYHTYNIGGLNIPLGKLSAFIEEDDLKLNPEKTLIVICQRGIRSKTAKTILEIAGFKKTRNLMGGLTKLRRIS